MDQERQIEAYICENLTGEAKETALDFIAFSRQKGIEFYKDTCPDWRDKIYYWLKFNGRCVAFVAIKDPDEPDHLWTVWSDDSMAFEHGDIDDEMKDIAWKYIDLCCHCGSCGGGRKKTVFGRDFDGVCGCTFRIDNPDHDDLPFMKKMVEVCMEQQAGAFIET